MTIKIIRRLAPVQIHPPTQNESSQRFSSLTRALHLGLALLAAMTYVGLAAPPLQADDEVTLNRIMAHPDWIGNAPESPYWAEDGATIFFWQKRQGEELRDLKRLDVADGEITDVPDEDLASISVPGGDWSHDRKLKVYSRDGDIFIADTEARTIRQLTRTGDFEHSPFFMTGDQAVAFSRDQSILVRDLVSGLESQPANLIPKNDPDTEPEPDDYLTAQQERLFDIVRLRKEREKAEKEQDREQHRVDPTRAPRPFYLGDTVEVAGVSLSPSGRWMVVTVAQKGRKEGRNDKMPHFVTASGYVEVEDVREKVGTDDPANHQLLLLDLASHEVHELDLSVLPGIDEDPLADIKAQTKAR